MNQSNPNDMSGSMPDAGFDWSTPPQQTSLNEPDLSLVMDLPVSVKVVLGRTKLSFRQLAQMEDGFVVELDSDSGRPVDLLVNGCLVARGEIVILNSRFGIRVTDIISNSERFAKKRPPA
jgi:flagellar motor switch protein FliN